MITWLRWLIHDERLEKANVELDEQYRELDEMSQELNKLCRKLDAVELLDAEAAEVHKELHKTVSREMFSFKPEMFRDEAPTNPILKKKKVTGNG